MESFPPEILDHIFNQFPNKCDLCQKKCLRASPRYVLSKCSNTCVRWNGLVVEKIVEIDKLKKCYSDEEYIVFEDEIPSDWRRIIRTMSKIKREMFLND